SARAAQALPFGRLLAAPGAEVILLRVLTGVPPAADPDATQRQLAEAAAALRRDRPDVHVDVVVASGAPATAISQIAAERRVDLIVLASHGHRARTTRILGSVADQVAATTRCPIFVVRADDAAAAPASPAIQRVVVPMDGSAQAARALAAAQTLATHCAAPICLLTAIDPAAVVPPAPAGVDPAAEHDALAAAEAAAQQLLEQAGARLLRAGQATSWQARRGPAAAVILAEVGPGDVLALRSRGGSGGATWPLGSVAAQVLRYASTPVLLLPAGPPESTPP
ncbi:MAG TPA: universal stress protein, partial [Thermomicrobiales bacterium]|nr:universal stress protein [Thermomicrobiales bacterium]